MNKNNTDNNNDKLKLLEEKIDKRFDILEKKIDKLISIFEKDISESCSKMSGHIDFVENVYDIVKSPLTYICNKVNYITGNEDVVALEDINNEEEIQDYDAITTQDWLLR